MTLTLRPTSLSIYASRGLFGDLTTYASRGFFDDRARILITCWSIDLIDPPVATLSFIPTNAALSFNPVPIASLSFEPAPIASLEFVPLTAALSFESEPATSIAFQAVAESCPILPVPPTPTLDFSQPENSQYLALFAYGIIGGQP